MECGHLLVTDPVDVAYLTGFHGGDSYLLLAGGGKSGSGKAGGGKAGKPVILSDFRFLEELEPQRSFCEVVIRSKAMMPALVELLADRGVRRLGVQGEHLTLATHQALTDALKRTGVSVHVTKGLLSELRIIKAPAELETMRKAIRIQQDALRAVLPTIAPGQTELSIAARLEAAMKERGSSTPAFESIIAARANGSLPHYRPSTTKTAKGQPLLIDWGAVYHGYRGDMTRTFSLGKWSSQMKEIYQIVLEAHELAVTGLRDGAMAREVDALARDYIRNHGYGEYFGHSLGHGLGMHTHEGPRVSHLAGEERLREGMVVTIEPGIYLPGVGGVRIEDDYVITKKGCENLCSLPKDLAWATL